jgi:hypothetical protein
VKLPTEAPVNGGRNYSLDRCSSENKIRLYAGKPEYPPVLAAVLAAVTIREVRAISRKGRASHDARNPQRPYAGPVRHLTG